jgi:hypothetical protein
MRLHRERRQAGLLCLTLEIREAEIVALVRRGLLSDGQKRDASAVRSAIYSLLDRHLGGQM